MFDKKFGNYLPDEETPVGVSEDGYEYYTGDILYYLDGTDEMFLDRGELMEWIKNNFIERKVV